MTCAPTARARLAPLPPKTSHGAAQRLCPAYLWPCLAAPLCPCVSGGVWRSGGVTACMPPTHRADSAAARAQAAGQPRARLAQHRRAHPARPRAASGATCGPRVSRALMCLTARGPPRCAGDRYDPLQPRTDSGAPHTNLPRARMRSTAARLQFAAAYPAPGPALLTRPVRRAQAASAVRARGPRADGGGVMQDMRPAPCRGRAGPRPGCLDLCHQPRLPCLSPVHAVTGRACPTLRRAQASPTSSACRCPRPSRPSTPLASGAAAHPASHASSIRARAHPAHASLACPPHASLARRGARAQVQLQPGPRSLPAAVHGGALRRRQRSVGARRQRPRAHPGAGQAPPPFGGGPGG